MKFYEFTWKSNRTVEFYKTTANSIEEALERATQWGYTPRKWYKPSTWGNHYIVY